MLVGYNHNFSNYPYYELSYQVPRGLSGAPLIFQCGNESFICGMIIGNEMTDMIVHSFKEKDQNGNKTRTYEKTETLHRGIAMQTASFYDIKSALLNSTIKEYLYANQLIT